MVRGLHLCTILDGIHRGFRRNNPRHLQYEPFKLLWIPPGKPRSEAQELMGEIYNSPAMLEAHKEIQKLKISDESCTLPRVLAAVMFGSDAMQLGPFGTQKAWMLYMWLGNLSKYERCKPNSGSCYKLAHIPSLPDSVKDEIAELNGRPPSASLLTHLRRELMHAVMQELLDADFIQAWQHGIVVDCADGIRRRVFPRIFTYSADYPERQKLVQRARDVIYKEHRAVDNAEVQRLLQPQSLVPTENAFSKRLLPFKFDFFKMFVVDLLHEIELGVWKSLLMHLIRIIHGCGSDIVAEFNRRFRQVPTFSGSTIRKFNEDVASLKRLAARDLEVILQLQPNLETTYEPFRKQQTTWKYSKPLGNSMHGSDKQRQELSIVKLQLNHTLKQPESYTELQHRKIKAQWFRTNMRDAIFQMTQIGDIGDALETIQRRIDQFKHASTHIVTQPTDHEEGSNNQPYGIGQSDRTEDAVNIPLWVQAHWNEPPVKFFIRSLKQHLLARITGEPEASELGKITFWNDRMYAHTTLRINYTSYDVRRQHDVINTKTPCRFILLPNDTKHNPSAHPFLYAKVLGIYHAKVKYCDRPPKRMDFVWVRWLDYDYNKPGGWEHGRLDHVRYGQYRNDAELLDAFDFIDPRHIVRACHMIPDFRSGHTNGSLSFGCDDDQGDWLYHTVNRFVDRDMLMRYVGGGVGHFNHYAPNEEQSTYDIDETELNEIEVERDDDQGGLDAFMRRNSVADEPRQGVIRDDESVGSDDDYLNVDEEEFEDELYDL